jgi:hypothetical protein
MAAFKAIRLVRSAISRMVPRNPVMRRVTAPSAATWAELSLTNCLSSTSRPTAPAMTARLSSATTQARRLASAD